MSAPGESGENREVRPQNGDGHSRGCSARVQDNPKGYRLAQRCCPDCTARWSNGRLDHNDTCPRGRAVDTVTEADAAWFKSHPGANEYWRPVTQVEQQEVSLAGRARPTGRVCVVQIEPGLRVRWFGGAS